MSEDFLCIGYEGMSRAIIDHNGERVFSAEQIKQRFGKEMQETKISFKMQLRKGQVANVCAWFSEVKRFFQEKGVF